MLYGVSLLLGFLAALVIFVETYRVEEEFDDALALGASGGFIVFALILLVGTLS